ncbi:MAG: hypothetical protein MZW92_02620 [Comamonadaceae bacterium]|nr:hypothetical protein [Comamonadaceae bacterium]
MLFQFDHMAADCHLVKWFYKKFRLMNLEEAAVQVAEGTAGQGLEHALPGEPRPAAQHRPLRRSRPLRVRIGDDARDDAVTSSRARRSSTRARRSA